mmetsp:Transcript_18285/g.30703  ORF Transcript_18285/g.30703 Transcript_18285/m.30703 type:complete len:301 (-) Transcript_18285:68-970(-)|eukprot:CAMPEP_0198222800 /NCGR_PEP_ID=MMETSP1445-20131203/89714_1 /TAXON_ID=36898 /ORGANISM="Pyramimonas sp., Strain CCMP2087" /LENGTH=300 /DNA_ID=CAMNT_0043901435 /DNA_START=58 /DNA_END=960 /DNA_ORIENTATION=-
MWRGPLQKLGRQALRSRLQLHNLSRLGALQDRTPNYSFYVQPSYTSLRSDPHCCQKRQFTSETILKHTQADEPPQGDTLTDAEAFRICAQCVKLGDGEVRESIAKGRDSRESASPFFCISCATILPLEDLTSTDYFSIFGMARIYRVDNKEIEFRYKALQRLLHPDKFATSSPEEKEKSADRSALVNEAAATLRSPLLRTQYLLKLQGIDVDASEEQTIDDRVIDPDLLMEVMETRMAVDEAQSQEELRPLRESNLEQIHACEETLAQAFDRSDLSAAQEGMIRLTYLCRIKDVILSKTD